MRNSLSKRSLQAVRSIGDVARSEGEDLADPEALAAEFGESAKRRSLLLPVCVDWTERRPHIGGAVGATLANRCFELKWIERARDNRIDKRRLPNR
jgi:hypothetical protein